MGPFDALQSAIGNGADLFGRAGRQEYWWFVVWFAFATLTVEWFFDDQQSFKFFLKVVLIMPLWLLLLTATVRRLHDLSYSGWLLLVPIAILALFAVAAHIGHMQTGPAGEAFSIQIEVFAPWLLGACLIGSTIFTTAILARPSPPFHNQFGICPETYGPCPLEVTQ